MTTTPPFDDIERQIQTAMQVDRFRLRRSLHSIRAALQAGKPVDRSLAKLTGDLQRSVALRADRLRDLPPIQLAEDLPITARAAEIGDVLAANRVLIVCGETGSGKSTQLPKICLQRGRGVDGMIGHTQPRRIAARSIATRLAQELNTVVGGQVGFKVRFTDKTDPKTYIKLMTDGILLAETQNDRFLDAYDTLIIDEAHERSLNIDFLLGYVRRLLDRRSDLKLIITSATIDAARFAEHFRLSHADAPAPIIDVSGRSYPVEIRYRPLRSEDADGEDVDQQQAIAAAVDELALDTGGDMLIFLPTERDIRETAKVLRSRALLQERRKTEIVPLYARLSASEQNKVFQPHAHRRIVLATNVAESSLTVPGIEAVIDTGTARISRYSPRSKVQRLPIEAISRASAEQRAGRCGRIGPGICIRLYDEEDFLGRDRFTTPEIRRTNLASVILQTKALKLGSIEEFPFLDPPQPEAIRDGYKTLFELGAMDDQRELTEIGRRLSRLPVDPRIGRMILAGSDEGCLHEIMIIAAVLEIQDPRERPVEKQQAADEAHAKFADEASDFVSFLKLWDFFHDLKTRLSRSQLRKACRQNFLSYNRMLEWQDIHRQLLRLADEVQPKSAAGRGSSQKNSRAIDRSPTAPPPPPALGAGDEPELSAEKFNAIHRALLTGLLSNVAYRTDNFEYTGAGGTKFHLWPGSGVFDKKPLWIVAAELVETTRQYARTVARIDPAWIEPLAGHLIKRSYSDPHWSARHGATMAYEKVTLFGLPIVQRRRVPYGPIDAEVSREFFIRHGLVEGQCKLRAKCLQHNRRLVEEIELLAKKSRRTDLFIDEFVLAEFYEARLPEQVYDTASFQKWLRQAEKQDPNILRMQRDEILPAGAEQITTGSFPDSLEVGSVTLPLEYRFEPGNEDDGVTVVVPTMAVKQVDAGRLGWLAPGLLEEKIVALIRSLPKSIRRAFVPAPETAKKVVAELKFGEGPFLAVVADVLQRVCGESVSPSDFREEKLPPHLQMNVRVVDSEGKTAATGRDITALQRQFNAEVAAKIEAAGDRTQWNREGITKWDFGDLPESITIEHGGIATVAYPMLVDDGESVSLRLTDSADKAARQSRGGIRRLFVISEKQELRSQVAWLPGLEKIKVYAASLFSPKQLEAQLAGLLADRTFLADLPLPRCNADFQKMRLAGRQQLNPAVQAITRLALPLFEAYHHARLAIEQCPQSKFGSAIADVRQQLQELTRGEFLTQTPWQWLQHYPRFFKAIKLRLDKLPQSGADRDQMHSQEIASFWLRYVDRRDAQLAEGIYDDQLEHFRWMIEEFRVSLFAQELRTSISVSAKRLEKQWQKTRK